MIITGPYDPDLLLAKALEWHQLANEACPTLRGLYLSQAAEFEERVHRSLYTPPISGKRSETS